MNRWKLGLLLVAACLITGCASNMKDGITFLEENKYEEALGCFEQDIADGKHLDEAYRGMGIAQYELGEYSDALDSFEQALENKTEETATLYSLMAASALKLEAYEDALTYYEKARKMEDCTEELEQEIRYNEIAVYQTMGDWETVKEQVASYVEDYPEDTRMDKTVEFLETR